MYLVDPDGYRRWIPGAVDYEALFGDNWSGIVATSEVNCIQARPPLRVRTDQCCGAVLIRGADTAGVYLYVDDTKRWIPSPAEFDKYSFNWDRIVVFPEVWMDEIPAGPAWT